MNVINFFKKSVKSMLILAVIGMFYAGTAEGVYHTLSKHRSLRRSFSKSGSFGKQSPIKKRQFRVKTLTGTAGRQQSFAQRGFAEMAADVRSPLLRRGSSRFSSGSFASDLDVADQIAQLKRGQRITLLQEGLADPHLGQDLKTKWGAELAQLQQPTQREIDAVTAELFAAFDQRPPLYMSSSPALFQQAPSISRMQRVLSSDEPPPPPYGQASRQSFLASLQSRQGSVASEGLPSLYGSLSRSGSSFASSVTSEGPPSLYGSLSRSGSSFELPPRPSIAPTLAPTLDQLDTDVTKLELIVNLQAQKPELRGGALGGYNENLQNLQTLYALREQTPEYKAIRNQQAFDQMNAMLEEFTAPPSPRGSREAGPPQLLPLVPAGPSLAEKLEIMTRHGF